MYEIKAEENEFVNILAKKHINSDKFKKYDIITNTANMIIKRNKKGKRLIIASNKPTFRSWWTYLKTGITAHHACKACSVVYYKKDDLFVIEADEVDIIDCICRFG